MYDIIIKGGTIIDGTGAERYKSDIGIKEGKIKCIGDLADERAERVIDAHEKIVAPGFIDGHSHSDMGNIKYPVNKISQGITTEVIGNCGFSNYPFSEKGRDNVMSMLSYFVSPPYNHEDLYRDYSDYCEEKNQEGMSYNFASMIGFGTLRAEVVGLDNRPATDSEIKQMCKLLDDELSKGAIGLSIGLVYLPQLYSTTEEINRLAAVLKKHDKCMAAHVRGEGDTLIQAVDEVISICKNNQIRLIISHLKAIGTQNWGKLEEVIRKIDEARAEGFDVMADCYYYECSATSIMTILPQWSIAGSVQGIRDTLEDEEKRLAIRDYFEREEIWPLEFVKQIIIYNLSKKYKKFNARTLEEISDELKKDIVDTVFELIRNEDSVLILGNTQSEKDFDFCVEKPYVMVGSDANPHDEGDTSYCNPRDWGAFPHFINRYVNEKRVLSLEEAIKKMAGVTAKCYRLKGRGELHVGNYADIIVFDEKSFKEGNSYHCPAKESTGLEYVIINGIVQFEKGYYLKKDIGQLLRY